jgi:hypothetical protein
LIRDVYFDDAVWEDFLSWRGVMETMLFRLCQIATIFCNVAEILEAVRDLEAGAARPLESSHQNQYHHDQQN